MYPQAELVTVDNLLESTRRRKSGSIDALGAPRMAQLCLRNELSPENVPAYPPFNKRDTLAKDCGAPRRPPQWELFSF